jgi:MYND finger
MSVRYCSEKCQADHWTNGGHRKECSRLRRLYSECIRIDKLPSTEHTRLGKDPCFAKPSHVACDEVFTLKIELIDQPRHVGTHLLHIYDKTVECDFDLKLNDASDATKYQKLLETVQGEIATAGTAVYLAASFDVKGVCTIYVNRRKLRTW